MKSNKFFVLFLVLSFLACLQGTYAIIDIDIYMEPEFNAGDIIQFNYTIDSDFAQTINYIEIVDCPTAPHAMLNPKSAFVNLGVNVHGKYNYLRVTEDIYPQECIASVVVLEPVKKSVSKPFTIVTTSPFDFDIVLDKKIFVRGEEIYIDYISGVDDPVLKAFLIYPDGRGDEISLPYKFKPNKLGMYSLQVNASKEGYKEVYSGKQFKVIDKEVDIKYANLATEGFVVKTNSGFIKSSLNGDYLNKIILYVIFVSGGLVVLIVLFGGIKKIVLSKKQRVLFKNQLNQKESVSQPN